MATPRRALLVGRFQPFHNGHLEAVRRIAADWDELVLGIGSADQSFTVKNPFSAGERYEMIAAALREAGLRNVVALPIMDMNRNAIWVSHVTSLVPRFRVFYTNNPLPARLFAAAGYEVRPIPFVERDRNEGTAIRALMRDGSDAWEKLVPAAVARLAREFGGPERLAALSRTDRTP